MRIASRIDAAAAAASAVPDHCQIASAVASLQDLARRDAAAAVTGPKVDLLQIIIILQELANGEDVDTIMQLHFEQPQWFKS